MNPQQLPYYIAGAEALLGLASRHFGAVPAPAPDAPASPPGPAIPNFMVTSLTKIPPVYVVMIGGMVFLGLVAFDGVRRVRKLERALAAAGVLR